MNKMILLFLDTGVTSSSLLQPEIWVCCPQCQQLAKITQQTEQNQQHIQEYFSVLCHTCFYRKSFKHTRSIGYSHVSYYSHTEQNLEHWRGECEINLRQKCLKCQKGKFILQRRYVRRSSIPFYIQAECNFCRVIQQFDQGQFQIKKLISNPTGIDPIFHYELFLSVAVAQGQICVYNPQHLQILTAYIQANLRQRTCTNYNRGYFSRLPAWIKSARHRKDILKALLRLEQMVSTLQPLHYSTPYYSEKRS